jgi:hypothetical protein
VVLFLFGVLLHVTVYNGFQLKQLEVLSREWGSRELNVTQTMFLLTLFHFGAAMGFSLGLKK